MLLLSLRSSSLRLISNPKLDPSNKSVTRPSCVEIDGKNSFGGVLLIVGLFGRSLWLILMESNSSGERFLIVTGTGPRDLAT